MNGKKEGAKFEEDFKKSFDKTDNYIVRLRDVIGYSLSVNPADFIVFNGQFLLLAECKTVATPSFSIGNFGVHQLWKMIEACSHPNVFGGYFIYFRKYQTCYYIDVVDFVKWYLNRTRKSIPYEWIQENGIQVQRIPKRTRARYRISDALDWVKENCYVDGQREVG